MKWLLAAALCACAGSDDLTGEVHRYHVDGLLMPTTHGESEEYGTDLDADGRFDNQLGAIMGALIVTGDASTHGGDMIASGALASLVDVQADQLTDDDTVAVSYLGADGDVATAARGMFAGGAFATSRRGAATVRLPIFADASPIELPLEQVVIELVPDGVGGYGGRIRGGIRVEAARTAAYAGVLEMMTTNPEAHLPFARAIDENHDGVIELAEVENSSLIASFVRGDVQLDGAAMLSVGFGVHLSASPAQVTPSDTCQDRVIDGDEAGIDCGGACPGCATGGTCRVPADCQSHACDAGACRAPTCSDGVRDGFESDVDCGAGCVPCAVGQGCAVAGDCASGRCDAAVGQTGACGS